MEAQPGNGGDAVGVPAVRRAGPRRPDGQRRDDEGADDLQRHRDRDDPRRCKRIPTRPTTPINAITLTRYRVDFRRTDGRNTPGVDVPYGFDGGLGISDQPGQLGRCRVRNRSPSGEARTAAEEPRSAAADWDSSRPSPRSRSMATTRTAMRSPSRDGWTCSLAISPTNRASGRTIMRTTTFVPLLGAAALAAVAGCTVKDVDQPALAGPSTFAHSITMVADRDTLTQNGVGLHRHPHHVAQPERPVGEHPAARADLRRRRPAGLRHAQHEDADHADDDSLYRAAGARHSRPGRSRPP